MDAALQRIIDLVHRRDELVARRASLTETIDLEIASIEAQLVSQRTAIGTTGASADTAPKAKAGSKAEAALKLRAENPRITLHELVMKLYGADDRKSYHALYNVISGLRKTRRWAPMEITEADAA